MLNRALATVVLTAAWAFVAAAGHGCAGPEVARRPERCVPRQPCWPTGADWQRLAASLSGSLEEPRPPLEPCRDAAASAACADALAKVRNPFFLQDQPGATQSTGMLDAWTAAASPYAVVAASADDIAAAVKFAGQHRLRLVIKATGHDYLGRSNAPDSLLIWTHNLRRVEVHDAFVPRGCPSPPPGVQAVSLGAGTRWLEAYQEVTVKHGRYVQGGGCTSVGAAGGLLQGGGFGSWSKKYGTAAAGLVEAEVVTADGQLRIANACQNQDLFWALRGGGGGTFGVVTKVTLRTHPLPSYFGAVAGAVTAKSDSDFEELVERFIEFYGEHLSDERWGEQVHFKPENRIELFLAFEGMTANEAQQVWRPFRAWVDAHADRFTMDAHFVEIPGNQMWNYEFLHRAVPIVADPRQEPATDRYWWWGVDVGQVSAFWYTYQSRWIPAELFSGAAAKRLAHVLFSASRQWTVSLHFNKGQAGAAPEALARDRETSMNPAVYRAAALAIVAASGSGHPGVPGHEPDLAEAERARTSARAAMKIIRDATPGAGAYVNEADYFEPDWQHSFWGENYEKLLAIKRKYDPENLFWCHHCVGSESGP